MRISLKLSLFLAGIAVLFIGLADALIAETRMLAAGYGDLMNTQVRQSDLARVTQVDFKKQVQEWKDILLRGHTSADLDKYTDLFRAAEARVHENALVLSKQIQDPVARQLMADFVTAHETLGKRYQEAYDTYVRGGFDFKAADRIVRGMDRQPTELFDRAVAKLAAEVQQSLRAQEQAVSHKQWLILLIAGAFLLVLTGGGFAVVYNVSSRLRCLKLVSDRLAKGEIAGLAIEIGGNDEVGEFGRSLQGVHDAIEELATARSGAPLMPS